MVNVKKIMKEHRSFKSFNAHLKKVGVDVDQVREWHRQIGEIESPTEAQERFIRCFYRQFHRLLGLKLEEFVHDRRYCPTGILEDEVFFGVVRAMYEQKVIGGSLADLSVRLVAFFDLPLEPETLRCRLSNVVINTAFNEALIKYIKQVVK